MKTAIKITAFFILTFSSFCSIKAFEEKIVFKMTPQDSLWTNAFECKFINDSQFYFLGYTRFPGDFYVNNYIRIYDENFNLLKHCRIDTTLADLQFMYVNRETYFRKLSNNTYFLGAFRSDFKNINVVNYKTFSEDFRLTSDVLLDAFTSTNRGFIGGLFTSENEAVSLGYYKEGQYKNYIFLRKTDSQDNEIWENKYNFYGDSVKIDAPSYAYLDKDSNYTFLYLVSYIGYEIYFNYSNLVKFSKTGELLYHKVIDSIVKHGPDFLPNYYEKFTSISGRSFIVDEKSSNIYAWKRTDASKYTFYYLDKDGNTIWTKEFNFKDYYFTELYGVKKLIGDNGELYLFGDAQQDIESNGKILLVAINSKGELIRNKFFDNNHKILNVLGNCFSKNSKGTFIGFVTYSKGSGLLTKPDLVTFIKFNESYLPVEDYTIYTEDMQIYPMPVNQDTKVKFDLSASSEVTLRLINELGIEVMSNKYYFEAGTQIVTVNTDALPSGTYICEIKSATETLRQKFLK